MKSSHPYVEVLFHTHWSSHSRTMRCSLAYCRFWQMNGAAPSHPRLSVISHSDLHICVVSCMSLAAHTFKHSLFTLVYCLLLSTSLILAIYDGRTVTRGTAGSVLCGTVVPSPAQCQSPLKKFSGRRWISAHQQTLLISQHPPLFFLLPFFPEYFNDNSLRLNKKGHPHSAFFLSTATPNGSELIMLSHSTFASSVIWFSSQQANVVSRNHCGRRETNGNCF